jgi:LuxR family transcriptional regulator, quorum-sensing system regulator SdiA
MMPNETLVVKQVTAHLRRLETLCNTGYALAIHIRYTRPSLMYRTYPQAWLEYYSEHGLMLSDPVVRWALTNEGAVGWDQLEGDDPAGVIAGAREHGLSHGVAYSVGPAESRTMAGVTRSTAFTDAEVAEMHAIVTSIHELTEGFDSLPLADQNALRVLG